MCFPTSVFSCPFCEKDVSYSMGHVLFLFLLPLIFELFASIFFERCPDYTGLCVKTDLLYPKKIPLHITTYHNKMSADASVFEGRQTRCVTNEGYVCVRVCF